jgi:uncharacterized protein (TIGR03437 family)
VTGFGRVGLRVVIGVLAGLISASGQTGLITTIAGKTAPGGAPLRGYSGDEGPGTQALLALANLQNTCDPNRFEQLVQLTIDAAGNVYFPDGDNQRIRMIDPSGVIHTIAGSGDKPATNSFCDPTTPPGDGGAPLLAKFFNPSAVTLGPAGEITIADQQDERIRQIKNNVINTIVGNGKHLFFVPNAPATTSPMDWPGSVVYGPDKLLYFAELHGNRVAKIDSNNIIIPVAGTGFPGYDGDNKAATTAQLKAPSGLAFDSAGNLYIADQGNHRVRKITPDGIIHTVAGNGTAGFSGDGASATAASVNRPMSVAADSKGNLYIGDTLNNRIRKVDAAGIITTFAGDGAQGRGPDNVVATASSLYYPAGVAVDSSGNNVYIADWQNYLIRKVTITTAPVIGSPIVNAASFAPYPVPVAPGSLITIAGASLTQEAATVAGSPWPTKMAGTTVSVNGSPIPLYYVSATQINAQLPYNLAQGSATLTVTTPAGTSASQPLNIGDASPGIYAYGGTSRAAAQNQDGSLNGPDQPEQRGRVIVLYLTGQGLVDPPVDAGQPAPLDTLSWASLPYKANIGGKDAQVLFLGLTPAFIGLAQANILIPADAQTGDDTVAFITIAGQSSNTVTISVR